MAEDEYEQFPLWIPALSAVQALSVYALGLLIISAINFWVAAAYLAFCLYVEYSVLTKSCIHCFYYGKWCGLGRGKICALFFSKGNPEEFLNREFSWKSLIPDLLVLLIPLVLGLVWLIPHFSFFSMGLILLLISLALGGSSIIRGSLACKYCRQKTLGCPAEKLFSGSAK